MEQTAVDWLVEQILKEKGLVDLDIEQANKMFEQQIINAYGTFLDTTLSNDIFKKHYNETFKNK